MAVKTPEEIERRHVPTIAKLRYGDTPSLAKLTPESARLAAVADATHSAALDVLTYIKRLRADPTQSEASRTLAEMQYARSTLARIDKMHDEAQRAANASIDRLIPVLEAASAPSPNPGQAQVDSEIRARIATMDDADAAKWIASDPTVRRAVVTAPRGLTGLAAERWNRLWREHVAAEVPDSAAEFEDLAAAVEAAKKARTAIHEEARQLIDWKRAELVEKAKV